MNVRGTARASLAVLAGYPAADAVNWVRANCCTQAVETPEQQAFVIGLGPDWVQYWCRVDVPGRPARPSHDPGLWVCVRSASMLDR